ncbi:MAG: hypothetical protein ACJ77E_06380 [Gaiellaceae bacterium]
MRRALLFLLAPALLAACGGTKSAGTTTTNAKPRPTQNQFVSAANAVCIRSDRTVFRLGRLSLDPAGWGKTAAAARRGVADMKRLTPPAGKDAEFRRLLTLGGDLAGGIQKVHDALVKKDYAKARAAQLAATRSDTAIHRQAQKLGLTFCQQLLTNWPA